MSPDSQLGDEACLLVGVSAGEHIGDRVEFLDQRAHFVASEACSWYGVGAAGRRGFLDRFAVADKDGARVCAVAAS